MPDKLPQKLSASLMPGKWCAYALKKVLATGVGGSFLPQDRKEELRRKRNPGSGGGGDTLEVAAKM